MSQVSYQAFQTNKEEREARQNSPRISFFGLKNDGDEAVVRFMHNSPEDFDIMYVHPVTINGKYRKVNCIREPKQPITDCPLCAAKQSLQTKVYIHLLEYVKDEQGNITAVPKIWERTSGYITTLKNLCDEYSPLSDNLFKIKRNGAAGSLNTTYAIVYARPEIYRPDVYIKDETAFENIRALGTAVIDKDYNGLLEYVDSNSMSTMESNAVQAPVNPQPAYSQPVQQQNPQPVYNQSTPPVRTYTPATTSQAQPTFNQPQPRTYNPGTASVAGQENTAFMRPRRLD